MVGGLVVPAKIGSSEHCITAPLFLVCVRASLINPSRDKDRVAHAGLMLAVP
jgi:hypothetical protein